MEKLLYSQYVPFESENIDYIILLLCHEMRIISAKQLTELINQSFNISYKTLSRHLINLTKEDQIDFIFDPTDKKSKIYYLTKKGHNSIGGIYTFPKVPEYNLNHHLQVTDHLIRALDIANQNPHFILAQSERRQMFEKKDMNKAKKGTVFHVADFILRFETKEHREVNWHFEIELSIKSRRRYTNSIFPKYLKLLNSNKTTNVLYISPKESIHNEMLTFKNYFFAMKKAGELPNIDDQVFQRLHVMYTNEFTAKVSEILRNDPYINW